MLCLLVGMCYIPTLTVYIVTFVWCLHVGMCYVPTLAVYIVTVVWCLLAGMCYVPTLPSWHKSFEGGKYRDFVI